MTIVKAVTVCLLVPLVAMVAAGCSGTADAGWSAQTLGAEFARQPLSVAVANSAGSLAVGPNRLSLAIFDRDGTMIHDAEDIKVRLFRLDSDVGDFVQEVALVRSQLVNEASGELHLQGHQDPPLATLYVVNTILDRAEWWGAEVSAVRGGKSHTGLRTRFIVSETSSAPSPGAPVPQSQQRVLRDVRDLAAIDSSTKPDPELHTETVKEALSTGQPVVIAVATPRFCQTRFCGPVVEQAVLPIAERFRGRVRVLHVEPFDLAQAAAGQLVPVPLMAEWGLRTEPWVFVVDGSGRLVAKFEGIVTTNEIEAALRPLLGR